MKYVKGFDTVRAFAVLFVIISHWGPFFNPGSFGNKIMTQVIPSGQFGVTLFFVLSGFLITSILLKERINNQEFGGSRSRIIKSFFVRRSLRIFPIYYLTLFVLFFSGYTYLQEHFSYYLLYLGNIPPYLENKVNPLIHMWSLAVEEQFYLVWPWVILFIGERYLKHVFIAAIVIGLVSKYIVLFTLHHDFPVLVVNWFDAFGIGGLYAYARLNEIRFRRFDKVFLIVLPLLIYIGWRIAPISGAPLGMMFTRTMDIVISLAIIIFVLNNKSVWIREYLLENRFLNFTGKISYGLYLYHYVLGPLVQGYINDWLAKNPGAPSFYHRFSFSYAVKFVLLYAVCWLSYKLIELPLLRLKDRFLYH